MSKGIKIIIALVVVAAVALGAVFLMKDSPDNNKNNNKEEETSQGSAESSVTITYADGSFSPSEVTVAAGGTVKVVNESDAEIEPSSDPHPTHTTNPEINAGDIPAGESKTFTVDSKGTWGYHNHYNPSEKGTIVVE